MTKFMQRSFTVPVGSPEYRDGWDRVFRRISDVEAIPVEDTDKPSESQGEAPRPLPDDSIAVGKPQC